MAAPADCAELLECARYGELPEMLELLDAGVPVDFQDESGNTALHRACANGHVEIVDALVARGARHLANATGNFPLHWAVMNKAVPVVKKLFAAYPDIDVLATNSFGKSCLTEAFNAQEQAILTIILEHKSAKELEKGSSIDAAAAAAAAPSQASPAAAAAPASAPAASGGKKSNKKKKGKGGSAAASKAGDAPVVQSITHDFVFGGSSGPVVRCREVGSDWTGDVFGKQASDDTTGMHIWAASLVFGHWLVERRADVAGKAVCELGAGCGVPGLAAAVNCGASRVLLTDLFSHTVDNLRHNVELNKGTTKAPIEVSAVDWMKPKTWPKKRFDVLLGCDLIYDVDFAPHLVRIVTKLLAPDSGRFFYVAGAQRDGAIAFHEQMIKAGFQCTVTSPCPDKLKRNPLKSQNDDDLLLYFNELYDNEFSLYEYFRESAERSAKRAELEALVHGFRAAKTASRGSAPHSWAAQGFCRYCGAMQAQEEADGEMCPNGPGSFASV
eukprot:m.17321 g.17321  ORF g.17321 m.17321 type:complete len:499 (-) comp3580_c0_seq2:130-1626(-)